MASTPTIQEQEPQNTGADAELESPDYGDNMKDLPEELVSELRSLASHFAGLEKHSRREEVINVRRQRFYYANHQYIYWNAAAFLFAPVSAGASVQAGSTSIDMPRYTDVYNIYTPYGRTQIAVLSENPPGVVFQPDDPMSAADIAHAAASEKFRHEIDRANDRKKLQATIARLFWTDGRTVLYTRTVKDAQRFGTDPETGEPKSGEIMEAFGVLEHKCPVTAKDQSQMPYQILSDEIDVNKAKHEYPDFKSKIKTGATGIGESSYERFARLGVLQGTHLLMQAGDAFQHLVTRHRIWLRPEAFEHASDDNRDKLLELFPEGCFVTFCGDAYVGARNESMDDHLVIRHPLPGDGQNRPSMGSFMVPLQDAFNDYMNLRKETYDYTIPTVWMNSELGDIDALREQMSEPGNHMPAEWNTGIPLEQAFFMETPPTTPPDLIQAIEDLRGDLAQFIVGAPPVLFGQSDNDNKTKGGIQMLRDQAMGQLNLPWAAMQELYAKAYEQAVREAAKNRAADQVINVAIPQAGQEAINQVKVSDLQKGSSHAYPDTDTSFPETTAAKRQVFASILNGAAQNPLFLSWLSVPDNMELAKEWIGLEDLTIPGAEARNKQLKEIQELLQGAPIPPTPEEALATAQGAAQQMTAAQMAGQPAPPPPTPESLTKSSVPVDPQFDYHQFEFETVQRWLTSPDGQQAKVDNPTGFENVRLHGLEHQKYMTPPPMPMPAPKAKPAPANQGPPAPASPLMGFQSPTLTGAIQ